jgi:hypothetical protein
MVTLVTWSGTLSVGPHPAPATKGAPAKTAVSDRPDRFVGVDLHKFTITMVCVDGTRKVVARRRMSNRDTLEIVEFLQSLGPLELTVEATASYDWFVRLVEPYALRVVLAHPGKLRVIAESTRKSDNLDARLLAEMLAMGHIPEAYRPTPRQREHRILVRHRQYLQRKITGAKNKIRRLLSNHNLDRDDLFTKAGQAALANMNLPDSDRFCVDQLVAQWKGFRQQLLATNQQLKAFAESGPREEREDRCLLGSVPGVGVVTTDVILAELAVLVAQAGLGVRRIRTGPTRIGRQTPEPAHRKDRLSVIAVRDGAGRLATGEAFDTLEADLRTAQRPDRRQEVRDRHRPQIAGGLLQRPEKPQGILRDSHHSRSRITLVHHIRRSTERDRRPPGSPQ